MLSLNLRRTKDEGIKDVVRRMPRAGNYMANQIAEQYVGYLKDNYLRGQMFGQRTRDLITSTKFFKVREGIFGVRPGVGIRGSLNYMLAFKRGTTIFPQSGEYLVFEIDGRIVRARSVTLPKKDLMGTSWRSFKRRQLHMDTATRIMNDSLRRVERS